ncbi:hypothetical protein B0H14DRAFT_2562894 [Mycena olivaceomarginata]|nr:hypothetical protein B0H14DRAFT_2562894 [Mycena olivaceomarginata]
MTRLSTNPTQLALERWLNPRPTKPAVVVTSSSHFGEPRSLSPHVPGAGPKSVAAVKQHTVPCNNSNARGWVGMGSQHHLLHVTCIAIQCENLAIFIASTPRVSHWKYDPITMRIANRKLERVGLQKEPRFHPQYEKNCSPIQGRKYTNISDILYGTPPQRPSRAKKLQCATTSRKACTAGFWLRPWLNTGV